MARDGFCGQEVCGRTTTQPRTFVEDKYFTVTYTRSVKVMILEDKVKDINIGWYIPHDLLAGHSELKDSFVCVSVFR